MTPQEPSDLDCAQRRAELATAWAQTIGRTAYVPMTAAEMQDFLLDQVNVLADAAVAELRELHLGYDRDATGEYLHFYTRTVGEVFLEFVERIDAYAGYGAGTAPVRLTAQGRR